MKKIAISLLFLLCTHIAKAQVDISTSQLIDTKWEKIISGAKYDSTTTLFTIDEMIDSTYNSLLEVSTIRSLNYYITRVKKEEGVISLCITLRSMKLTTTPSCHLQMTN